MAIPFAILCALALAGVGASLFSFVYTKTLVDAANRRTVQLQARLERALQDARSGLDELSADMRDWKHQPPVMVNAAAPRAGINLTTRSQVLRLHRRGQKAEEIAKILAVPRQEVDLLIKVHGIVLNSMNLRDR